MGYPKRGPREADAAEARGNVDREQPYPPPRKSLEAILAPLRRRYKRRGSVKKRPKKKKGRPSRVTSTIPRPGEGEHFEHLKKGAAQIVRTFSKKQRCFQHVDVSFC